jgi:hypothetical protein
VTRALDGDRERTLVLGTRAEFSPGLDLAALRQMATKVAEVLVVDFADVVRAERADLAARRVSPAATGSATAGAVAAVTALPAA